MYLGLAPASDSKGSRVCMGSVVFRVLGRFSVGIVNPDKE
jgi:hypothetical protein